MCVEHNPMCDVQVVSTHNSPPSSVITEVSYRSKGGAVRLVVPRGLLGVPLHPAVAGGDEDHVRGPVHVVHPDPFLGPRRHSPHDLAVRVERIANCVVLNR
jgi:hypothetical protein